VIPTVSAQQRQAQPAQRGQQQAQPAQRGQQAQPAAQRQEPLPTMESLPEEVARLKALVPSNSHIMMDVQWHWTNLWFAGQAKNWPLAQYYFNEARGHIQWFVKKSPTLRSAGPDREEVNIEGIFDGIDTSSLMDVKNAIAQKNSAQFASTYKIMLESCYSCHKSAGRPYIRPQIPKVAVQAIVNLDPNATWPQ
jgi:cytochrome c553